MSFHQRCRIYLTQEDEELVRLLAVAIVYLVSVIDKLLLHNRLPAKGTYCLPVVKRNPLIVNI